MTESAHDTRCPRWHTRFRGRGKTRRFACPVCAGEAASQSLPLGHRALYLVWGLAPALLTPFLLGMGSAAHALGLPRVWTLALGVTLASVGFPALLFSWSHRLYSSSSVPYPLLASIVLTPLMLGVNAALAAGIALYFGLR